MLDYLVSFELLNILFFWSYLFFIKVYQFVIIFAHYISLFECFFKIFCLELIKLGSSKILSIIKDFIIKFSIFSIKNSISHKTTSIRYFFLNFTNFCFRNSSNFWNFLFIYSIFYLNFVYLCCIAQSELKQSH